MAIELDKGAKKMLLIQQMPVYGFRAQQADELMEQALRDMQAADHQMNLVAADLAGGYPIGEPATLLAEKAALAMWGLCGALVSLGISPEAVMATVRENNVSGAQLSVGSIVYLGMVGAIGAATGVEVVGGIRPPVAGDEVPSYAVTPEPPPETPPEETLP